MARLQIKVVPGASHDAIEGWMGESLKIRIRARPERGRANTAVIALLAATVEVPRSAVVIRSGHTSRHKIVDFENVALSELMARLPPRDDRS